MSAPTLTELLDLALQAERLGRFAEARESLRKAIALDGGPATLDARLRLGRLLIGTSQESDLAEAERELTTARSLAEQAGAQRSAAVAIHGLALLARNRNDPARTQQLLDESPAASEAAAPNPARAQWLHYHGLLRADRGDLNAAERFYFRAHQVYQECHSNPGLAWVCDSLANLLVRRGKPAYALRFAQQSLELKRELGDRFGMAISHGTAGRALHLLARYEEAAEEFRQDLEIARELGDTGGVGIMLNSLGEVALLRGDREEASRRYQDALTIEAGPEHSVHAHLGLARVLLAATPSRIDEAAAQCDSAAAILDNHPWLAGLSVVLNGLRGAIAWRRGDFQAGQERLNATIAALEAGRYPLDTVPFLYELRDLNQAQQARAEAVVAMARALDLLSECGSERGVQDVEDWLRNVDTPNLVRLALERHFPTWLIDDMLKGRLGRPPSRTQSIVVLFSDIRDFSALTEGLGAEQVVQLLNEWFSEVARIVRRHGGFIDKFIGDAVMALFGVPEPRESMAADAVRAALEMRDVLDAINMRHRFLDVREIRIGIGIDQGEAVVGFIGSHLRQSYTAIGEVVNTASRLETATKEHECDILISDRVDAVQRRSGVAETQFVGRLELKGIGQAVSAFKVLAPLAGRPAATPGEPGPGPTFERLSGKPAERASLH
jgi:class 3 adenylate cyclase/tetratricopeptide (TPR) repeat protein